MHEFVTGPKLALPIGSLEVYLSLLCCPRGSGVMDKVVACRGIDASDLGACPVAS